MVVFAISNVVWTALIFAIGGPLSALAVGWQLNRQRRAEKLEDYRRQDEVAETAEKAAADLAASNKAVADEAARQQAEVAATAAQAAKLLLEAQEATTARTDEVARLAADRPRSSGGRLLAVVISYPNGNRREIMLDAVPRVGDHVWIRGVDPTTASQVVKNVLWLEANGGEKPSVIVVVCPDDSGQVPMPSRADVEPLTD